MADAQSVPPRPAQLALELSLDDEATFANFMARPGLAQLLAGLQDEGVRNEALHFFHGAAGVGKSHLLQALCHEREGSVYLPLGLVEELPPGDLLQDLEQAGLLAIDDLDRVAGRRDWEEALFHLFNRARAGGCHLLVAASRPAPDLPLSLADLSSRLASGLSWAMPACDDEELRDVLAFRAQRRGLVLGEPVLRYLCERSQRDLPQLLASLERLDQASLERQRAITVPLVREVMGW